MGKNHSKYILHESLNDFFSNHKKSSMPSRLDMELTERCNNNCIHCYINQEENNKELINKELSTKELKDIITKAADIGVMSIRFTGGEPLLRTDFKEIYLFTKRLGIKITLFTNATLINKELIELFKQYPPGDKIEVTLYGLSKEKYEKVSRTPGTYKKAMKGINLLLDANIPFIIKSVYITGKQEEIKEFEEFSKLIPYMDHNPGFSMNFDLRARRDSTQKNNFIKSLRTSPEETIKIIGRKKQEYRDGMKEFAAKFMRPAKNSVFSCGCGKGGSIDAYGYLQPCLLMRHPDTIYDLKNGTFKDAFESFFKTLRKLKSNNPEYLKKCGKCFLNGLCERCSAKSWMEHGKLDTPVEYYCEIAHAKAKLLGLIYKGEKAWEVVDYKKRIKKFTKSLI
ncbi:MAG: radical SAM protein [Desulfobacteraceae bacterium]|nr:radical SAM protein [Desulfobacteraceae bacterium]